MFDRAADLPESEQLAIAERECGNNPALRDELLRLLAAHAGPDLLEQPSASPCSLVGTRIGPYLLVEKLGEGGMGAVYAAEQVVPVTRRVALKLIKPGMDTAHVVARFNAERQALARMSHPNVAHVYDGGSTVDGRPYFAMELVIGEPVTAHCDRHKYTTRQRLEVFLRICDGVQHAHLKGLIHRDLKPSNLLVTSVDGHDVPKVIDFGIAREISGDLDARAMHTRVGQVMGTLDYMSPEQADAGRIDIDTRSDVYSLGVVLYQLLSGLLPFEHLRREGVPLSELQRAIVETDPPTPSTGLRHRAAEFAPLRSADPRALIRQLTGDLDWICLKALSKDPANRYQSVAALAEDVRRHILDQPVSAGRPSRRLRLRKFVRRHRVGVAAGTVAFLAVVVGVSGVVAGGLAATARANELLNLSDQRRLQQLVVAADTLWPPYPVQIPAMRDWLQQAQELFAHLPRHRVVLEEMRGRSTRAMSAPRAEGEGVAVGHDFASAGEQWYHDQLTQLVEDLQQFGDGLLAEDAIAALHGWSVPKRLRCAERLAVGFAPEGEYSKAWAAAMPAIEATYPGIRISEQDKMGLVPIGQDPVTHFWEFAHLISGEIPQRDTAQRLVLSDDMAIVLVLLPGDPGFQIGTQQEDPAGAYYDPNPNEYKEEAGLTAAPIAPFLLAKFEMTMGQWRRFAKPVGAEGGEVAKVQGARRHALTPITMVTWKESREMLLRLGLALPNSRQWEYGARGGTTTMWWWGRDYMSMPCAENILDLVGLEKNPGWRKAEEVAQWYDQQKLARIEADMRGPAPVGSYLANPFGLYDVAGNVSEWVAARARKSPLLKTARGGNHQDGPERARSAAREHGPEHFLAPVLGLRAARNFKGD